jgi:hypothetical protein
MATQNQIAALEMVLKYGNKEAKAEAMNKMQYLCDM